MKRYDKSQRENTALKQCVYSCVGMAFVLGYYVKNKKHSGIRGLQATRVFIERFFGIHEVPTRESDRVIWLHISGLGDCIAGISLLESMSRVCPGARFWVTCGSEAAHAKLEGQPTLGNVVGVAWLPFDLPWAVRRTLRTIKPVAFVSVQGEFWPILLRSLAAEHVPPIALRVDMLDWEHQREFPGWVRPFYEQMLSYICLFSVRSIAHKERLVSAGVASEKVVIGHDYRFLSSLVPDTSRREYYRSLLGLAQNERLVIFAGPRIDEVESLLPGILNIARGAGIRLLIAPGELDRVAGIANCIRRIGGSVAMRSALKKSPDPQKLILLDTYGELFHLYSLSHVTIVGDTFYPAFSVGANLWEALIQGNRVIFGPEMTSTQPIEQIVQAGFAFRLESAGALAVQIEEILSLYDEQTDVGRRVAEILERQPDAALCDASTIVEWLNSWSVKPSKLGRTRKILSSSHSE